ncbi:hypothetical protein [Aminipila terrae]|uniref:Polyketide cyclase n=1 Tax=Aminipila terrae TaxID=2697030 RepID=A0A6P1MD33_9FIRM|nr:hypothetical protein [Aminipila terrae]QHI71741.1 hypothetical protein Ami3637_04485 [Aminipila terrae]
MRKSRIVATFDTDIQNVWSIVTNNKDYKWRSDLSNIEITDDKHFTEYTKNGYATDFTIQVKEEYRRYEFDMKNKNMTGHWTGLFSETENGGTKIDFIEEIHIKNPILSMLSYIFMNLKKMQETYVEDLRKKCLELRK